MHSSLRIRKVFRSIKMWGLTRTIVKIFGRSRKVFIINPPIYLGLTRNRHIAIIGCGQFAFSTIGFFLKSSFGNCILTCYDIDKLNATTFAKYYMANIAFDVNEIISDQKISLVYIASNHASHSYYAINLIRAGKNVFIEKPISTSFNQYYTLKEVIEKTQSKVYVGYNRPFSPAIRKVVELLPKEQHPMTINCFIIGHKIPSEHWYRDPDEGTRICGNVGHWIDLSTHLIAQYSYPEWLNISITYSDKNEYDDNLTITIVTPSSDIISITLSSRSEPFEGINETINIQCGDLIVKIDDFKKMSVWHGEQFSTHNYWPKNVGHKDSILQPFSKNYRDWSEVDLSTRIMLFVSNMVKNRSERATFDKNMHYRDA